MDTVAFQALGAHWTISLDGATFSAATKEYILGFLRTFESRFSRFIPESEVNAFRSASAGTFPVSPEFALLLARAQQLREWTRGAFDPAVASVLERAGYDRALSLSPKESEGDTRVPAWSLSGGLLTIEGPIAFDLGGIGKGYAIDRVADILRADGCVYFLVEGGGDMVGTTKADGSGWRVAVAWPGREEGTIASVVTLQNQGFAASDTLLRRWGKWHHIIDMRTQTPVETLIGAAVIAPEAFAADVMTSALFLLPQEEAPAVLGLFGATAMTFAADGSVSVDSKWSGEMFV